MDQDGANNKFLTLGNELVLTPRFNPTSQMVTIYHILEIYQEFILLDIETGMQEVVGDFPGMTFAPDFLLMEKNNNEFCKRWKLRYLYYGFRK